MRYPLAFGLITALIASGIMINFAAENQKQREAKRQQEQHQSYLAAYRFEGPVAPVGRPGLLVGRSRKAQQPTIDSCCNTEAEHSAVAQYDQAGIFRQIGWQKKDKAKSQQELIQISVADARKEVLDPHRFEFKAPVRKIKTALWKCGDAFEPNPQWEADLRRAAARRSAAGFQPEFNPRPTFEQKIAGNFASVPSDAVQTDVDLNLLAISQANSIRHSALANHPTFQLQSLDFQSLTRSFPKSFGHLTDQLVQNAMPKQDNYSGCGSSVVAERIAKKSQPSFEDAVLAGVCEINRIAPASINHDPFHRFSAHVRPVMASRVKSQPISAGLSFVAQRLIESGDGIAQRFSQVADWAGQQSQQTDRWAHSQFSTVADSISVAGVSIFADQDNSLAEAPLQPIPAANNLGIRAAATKLHQWFTGETKQVLTRTANVSRTVGQWGMQQNAAMERTVLQHNDRVQR